MDNPKIWSIQQSSKDQVSHNRPLDSTVDAAESFYGYLFLSEKIKLGQT